MITVDVGVRIIWLLLLVGGAILVSIGLYYTIQKSDLNKRKEYALVQLSGLMLWLILICLIMFWPYQ